MLRLLCPRYPLYRRLCVCVCLRTDLGAAERKFCWEFNWKSRHLIYKRSYRQLPLFCPLFLLGPTRFKPSPTNNTYKRSIVNRLFRKENYILRTHSDTLPVYTEATRFFFLWRNTPNLVLGLPAWNSPFHFGLLDLRHSVGLLGPMISSSQGLYLYTNTEKRTHTQTLNIHALSGIRTQDPSFRASEDSACLRPLGYRDRLNRHDTLKQSTPRSFVCACIRIYFSIRINTSLLASQQTLRL
jgi:hypothetical protein